MKNVPFSRSAVIILAAAATGLFALSVLMHAYGSNTVSSGSKAKPGAYSVSAIGHAGFYEVLRRLKVPAKRSIGNTLNTVGSQGTLILAEPDMQRIKSEDSLKFLKVPRLLLVLPKWYGQADEMKPAWISQALPMPRSTTLATLALVDKSNGQVLLKPWPAKWAVNEIGYNPSGSGSAQLMTSKGMRPVVGTEEGMLVGEISDGDRRVWVLSDPDIMSNHGLKNGDNAIFMVTLVEKLRRLNNSDSQAPLVFDETVHGFHQAENSPLKMFFKFPFVVLTLLAGAAAILLILAGGGRFGAPQKPRPNLDFGKAHLIGNSARLLDYAGHQAEVLIRYVRLNVRAAAKALHAPAGLSEQAAADWLDRVGRARGLKVSSSEILRSLAAIDPSDRKNLPRLFECARAIHRWKGEMYGSSTRRRHN